MNRTEKAQEIEAIKARLADSSLVVLTHNKGITAQQSNALRRALGAEGATYKVAKNTLMKLAIKGTKYEGLADKLTGPVGIATSKDPVAAARIVHGFAKETNDKLVIIGGANDTEILSLDKVKFLATLPSLDGLRGKLVGLLQAPGAQLARLANAYATKDQPSS
jgi:large subunit ribosomal protein L10